MTAVFDRVASFQTLYAATRAAAKSSATNAYVRFILEFAMLPNPLSHHRLLDSAHALFAGSDPRYRLLLLLAAAVTVFVIFAHGVTDDKLVTFLVALLLFSLVYITRHIWHPPDYGRNRVRRLSLYLLFASYNFHAFFYSAVATFVACHEFLPDSLHDLVHIVPPATPSTALQIAITAAVVATNYFLRDKSAMTESLATVPRGLTKANLHQQLEAIGSVLLANLNDIDRATAWSTHYFEPLHALVEVTGQRRPVRTLQELLPAIRTQRHRRTFLVIGDPGSGKSVALRKLARDLTAEIAHTGRLPVYVDLKDWVSHTAWTPNGHLPTDSELYDFIEHSILKRGDVFVEDFLKQHVDGDSMFKYLLQQGRFFFILDSFDEIPQVLSAPSDAKWLIDALSRVIYRTLAGGYQTRGVLASRPFRRPSAAFDTETTLEIRPFSDLQVRSCLARSKYYSDATLKELFSTRVDLISALRNPFTIGLLVAYARHSRGTLPATRLELYDVYLRSLLVASREMAVRTCRGLRSPFEEHETLQVATEMAAILINSPTTLEASLPHLARSVRARYGTAEQDVVLVAEILSFARIARLDGRTSAQQFGFVHRRFAEYLVARSLPDDADELDLQAIPDDRPMREVFALYCDIADDRTAARIADYCWTRVQQLRDRGDAVTARTAYREAIHCLRFLSVAFRARLSALRSFRERLGELVIATITAPTNMLTVKLVVEAAGLLGDSSIDRAVTASLRLRNSWISETALGACRHLAEPSPKLRDRLRDDINGMPPLEFLGRRAELLFSLSLSDGFACLRRMCKLRVLDTYLALAGLALALVGDVLLLAVVAVPVVVMRIASGLLELADLGLGLWIGEGARDGPTWAGGMNLWLEAARVLYSSLAGLVFVGLGNTVTGIVLGSTLIPAELGWVAPVLVVPYYRLWLLGPWLGRQLLALMGGVVTCIVILLGLSVLRTEVSRDFVSMSRSVVKATVPGVVAGLGLLLDVTAILLVVAFSVGLLWYLRARYRDWTRMGELERRGVWTREQIANGLAGFSTARGRAAFVARLDKEEMEPAGEWPDGELPNYGNDVASIRLAQLEERWLDLGGGS